MGEREKLKTSEANAKEDKRRIGGDRIFTEAVDQRV